MPVKPPTVVITAEVPSTYTFAGAQKAAQQAVRALEEGAGLRVKAVAVKAGNVR